MLTTCQKIIKSKQELTKLKQFAACCNLFQSSRAISKCLLNKQQEAENLFAGIQTFLNLRGLN
jgi:hypothetical protein